MKVEEAVKGYGAIVERSEPSVPSQAHPTLLMLLPLEVMVDRRPLMRNTQRTNYILRVAFV